MSFRKISQVLIILSLALLPSTAYSAGRFPDNASTHAAIKQILNTPDRLPFHLQRVRKALTSYYIDDQAGLFWTASSHMQTFIQRLLLADDDGLRLADYPADYLINLYDTITPQDPVTAAYAELTFSSFFLSFATDIKTGRFVPKKIDPDLFQPKRRVNKLALLRNLGKTRNLSKYLSSLAPKNRHYRALIPLVKKYRKIADVGGWGIIRSGVVLKPGMSDPRIPQIRQRLQISGDMPRSADSNSELYDNQLARAVKSYQRRHGLNDEGIIGKLTLIQMNVPARERLRQIIVNMERWRWMPEHMGRDHLMVNIAAFQLYRIENNRQVETINVVVGQKYHQTPVFSDELEYVVLNPNWTVPFSIATKELLPKLQKDPAYLKADFEVLKGGRPVSPYSIDWTQYSPSSFPFVFRQKPGPKNALGQVKFIMPNRHSIYLHDTPSKHLFGKTSRAFSHGCIRVHKPVHLADVILSKVPGWSPVRIRLVLDERVRTRVNLPKHIPVHIVYATVWAGKNGEVNFRPDIYRRDYKLYRAIFGKKTS